MRNILWVAGLGALVWIGAHAGTAVMAPLMTAFRATGAQATGYSINDWVQVKNGGTMAQLAHKVGTTLHWSTAPTQSATSQYQKLTENQTVAGITTRLIVEQLSSSGATFVVLDRTSPQGFSGLYATETLFSAALKGLGNLHSDVNLEGTLPGHLTEARQRRTMQQSLEAIGAASVNGVNTPGYLSMSARSPFIKGSDNLQGHSVNVQVAVSYNSYLHATQVFVGSPLITVTY